MKYFEQLEDLQNLKIEEQKSDSFLFMKVLREKNGDFEENRDSFEFVPVVGNESLNEEKAISICKELTNEKNDYQYIKTFTIGEKIKFEDQDFEFSGFHSFSIDDEDNDVLKKVALFRNSYNEFRMVDLDNVYHLITLKNHIEELKKLGRFFDVKSEQYRFPVLNEVMEEKHFEVLNSISDDRSIILATVSSISAANIPTSTKYSDEVLRNYGITDDRVIRFAVYVDKHDITLYSRVMKMYETYQGEKPSNKKGYRL